MHSRKSYIVFSTVIFGGVLLYHSRPHITFAQSLTQQNTSVLNHIDTLESYSNDLRDRSIITATSIFTVYLPGIARQPEGLYGRVTLGGQPAANERIYLYALCITTDYVHMLLTQATTDEQGIYRFVNIPSLPYYKPRTYCWSYQAFYGDGFVNTPNYPVGPWLVPHAGRIYALETRTLPTYTAGTSEELESFDIGEIVPITNMSETVALPTTFRWLPRSNATSTSYTVWLFDYYCKSSPCVKLFSSGKLGYVDHFELDDLPDGYSKNTPYDWLILTDLPTGGIAYSPYLKVAFK